MIERYYADEMSRDTAIAISGAPTKIENDLSDIKNAVEMLVRQQGLIKSEQDEQLFSLTFDVEEKKITNQGLNMTQADLVDFIGDSKDVTITTSKRERKEQILAQAIAEKMEQFKQ